MTLYQLSPSFSSHQIPLSGIEHTGTIRYHVYKYEYEYRTAKIMPHGSYRKNYLPYLYR
eukprot:jgi/Psemu1/301731/fgenesh1_kg.43_\